MIKTIRLIIIALLLHSMCLSAATVGGVDFPDRVSQEGGAVLQLNGLGIRQKWIVNVYAAGLYLPTLSSDADFILSEDQPKQMRMHFLYKKVSKEKLLGTLEKGFEDNLNAEELDALSDQIDQLKTLFKTVYKGDEVVLNYVPHQGTELIFNEQSQGVIPGFAFQQAIFRVWLGSKPADKKLKQQLLGERGKG